VDQASLSLHAEGGCGRFADYGGIFIWRMDTHDTRQWCCVERALDHGRYLYYIERESVRERERERRE